MAGRLLSTERRSRRQRGARDGGWHSDPFFADRPGTVNRLRLTGDDFFADKDVCSIVLEIPKSTLTSGKVTGDNVVPTTICSPNFATWGVHTPPGG